MLLYSSPAEFLMKGLLEMSLRPISQINYTVYNNALLWFAANFIVKPTFNIKKQKPCLKETTQEQLQIVNQT